MKTSKLLLSAATIGILASAAQTQAANISDLYNTGVDNAGAVLADNASDTHYTITAGGAGSAIVATSAGGFPIGPWLAEDSNSAWATPAANTEGGAGTYTYSTTFTLPANTDLTSVSITGQWATDDGGVGISANGADTANPAASGFSAYTPFTINDANANFVVGVNTLTFSLSNGGGPTGLRVDDMVGTFSAVPEPASLSLLGLGGLGLLSRRRRA